MIVICRNKILLSNFKIFITLTLFDQIDNDIN